VYDFLVRNRLDRASICRLWACDSTSCTTLNGGVYCAVHMWMTSDYRMRLRLFIKSKSS